MRRPRRLRHRRPPLTAEMILAWADDHFARTGRWPTSSDEGEAAVGEKWRTLDAALRRGCRGLPGRSSLPRLLAERRGVRNLGNLPDLTEEQILAWADDHKRRTGDWPRFHAGPVLAAPGEKWSTMDEILRSGGRGHPGGTSVAQLLERERGVRNLQDLPDLNETQILEWAQAHHRRTGHWPGHRSGPIADAAGESWAGVANAVGDGRRGLPGRETLGQLLARRLGVRNHLDLPPLKVEQLLAWADAHHERSGQWPRMLSGPIPEAPGETWQRVDSALREGCRGLAGGSSLAQLLMEHRGARNKARAPRLTHEQVLAWADAHFARTGQWPRQLSGRIPEAPEETWGNIQVALRSGWRGFPGGDSLFQLLKRQRIDKGR